jgi:hypothetical protein
MSVFSVVRARERDGRRLSSIAEAAEVDYGRLWRACRGGSHLTSRELERLAGVLDLSPDERARLDAGFAEVDRRQNRYRDAAAV